MSSSCNTLWCEGKQILDAGSWMLDETLAQTWIASLIARGQLEAPRRARNVFVFYLSSTQHRGATSVWGEASLWTYWLALSTIVPWRTFPLFSNAFPPFSRTSPPVCFNFACKAGSANGLLNIGLSLPMLIPNHIPMTTPIMKPMISFLIFFIDFLPLLEGVSPSMVQKLHLTPWTEVLRAAF